MRHSFESKLVAGVEALKRVLEENNLKYRLIDVTELIGTAEVRSGTASQIAVSHSRQRVTLYTLHVTPTKSSPKPYYDTGQRWYNRWVFGICLQ
jgi:hypothetical protein